MNKKRYKFNITEEIREKIQAESTQWSCQVYDQSEVLSEFGRKNKYNFHPTLIEMCYFSKFFGVSPADMIGKDMKAQELLRRNSKHRI